MADYSFLYDYVIAKFKFGEFNPEAALECLKTRTKEKDGNNYFVFCGDGGHSGWFCSEVSRQQDHNGIVYAFFWQGLNSTYDLTNFKLDVISVLNWIHDNKKTLA